MLTEKEVRNAKPRDKLYKLFDGNGLLLRVKPNGTKSWDYKFRVQGSQGLVEKSLALGLYPEVSLKEARDKCATARKQKQQNLDPAEEKKSAKRLARFQATNTFEAVAGEWYENKSSLWSPDHATRLWNRLERHIFPALGKRPVEQISALELLEVLQKVENDKKTETSHRLLQICRSIFQHAILTKRATYNPAYDLKGALKPHKSESYRTIGHNRLTAFCEKLETVKTSEMNKFAVKLLMLTFVRQGELRQAMWDDIDFKANEWRVRPETTKMRELHIVPLSKQAVKILNQLRLLSGDSIYLFPSQQKMRNPIMSENTINKVIGKMGFKDELVGHGFRAMASTILHEHQFPSDAIERQLAHMPRNKVKAAYNRAQYLPVRVEIMKWWGNHLQKSGLKLKLTPRRRVENL